MFNKKKIQLYTMQIVKAVKKI